MAHGHGFRPVRRLYNEVHPQSWLNLTVGRSSIVFGRLSEFSFRDGLHSDIVACDSVKGWPLMTPMQMETWTTPGWHDTKVSWKVSRTADISWMVIPEFLRTMTARKTFVALLSVEPRTEPGTCWANQPWMKKNCLDWKIHSNRHIIIIISLLGNPPINWPRSSFYTGHYWTIQKKT